MRRRSGRDIMRVGEILCLLLNSGRNIKSKRMDVLVIIVSGKLEGELRKSLLAICT